MSPCASPPPPPLGRTTAPPLSEDPAGVWARMRLGDSACRHPAAHLQQTPSATHLASERREQVACAPAPPTPLPDCTPRRAPCPPLLPVLRVQRAEEDAARGVVLPEEEPVGTRAAGAGDGAARGLPARPPPSPVVCRAGRGVCAADGRVKRGRELSGALALGGQMSPGEEMHCVGGAVAGSPPRGGGRGGAQRSDPCSPGPWGSGCGTCPTPTHGDASDA